MLLFQGNQIKRVLCLGCNSDIVCLDGHDSMMTLTSEYKNKRRSST